jgi:DNA (cytosine-5)-methyltransferase 1
MQAQFPGVVSLFAGAGGSSLGYELAGFRVALAVEWDDNAVACYRANHPSTPVYHGDIAKLSVAEVLATTGLREGELDVLDGSPPCQGFSTAGKRVLDDPRNSLFKEYVRLLRGLRPRAFVMENVSGMVKGKMRLVFAEAMRELKQSGYRVRCQLMNAMHFGVPQSRQRVIFIGARDDLGVDPSHPAPRWEPVPIMDVLPGVAALQTKSAMFDHAVFDGARAAPALTKSGHGEYYAHVRHGRIAAVRSQRINPFIGIDGPAATLCKTATGYEAQVSAEPAALPEDPEWQVKPRAYPALDHYWHLVVDGRTPAAHPAPPKLSAKYQKLAERVQQGESAADHDGGKGYQSCVRHAVLGPSGTLPKMNPGGGFATPLHPVEHRSLSIAEAKRLQSFPDDYILLGPFAEQWARIGNSVPPLLMLAVAEHVCACVLDAQP